MGAPIFFQRIPPGDGCNLSNKRSMSECQDEGSWIEQARLGDPSAFEKLVRRSLHWLARRERRERLHRSWTEETAANTTPLDAILSEVQSALLKLPAKQRAAIVLTVYDGLNHAEAARMLGCSEATVSWRVFMARSRLKRLLQGSNLGPGKRP